MKRGSNNRENEVYVVPPVDPLEGKVDEAALRAFRTALGPAPSGVRTLFDVPLAAVRVWDVAGPYIDADFTQGASEDARAFASSLTMPFCGPNLGFEPAGWLAQEAGEPAQSLALLPLREGAIDSATPAFGLLVLGSPDPQRFDATMGTEFLSRIAELASAALVRLK